MSLDLELDGEALGANSADSPLLEPALAALQNKKPSSVKVFGAQVWAALAPWVLPLLLLVFWEGASRLGLIPARVLPAPSQVAIAFWESAKSGELWRHTAVSTERALKGLLFGGAIGFFLGVVNGVSRQAEALLDSSLQMLRNVPHLAIIPLVILWFGIDEEAKIFLVAIGVFFPIYLNTFHGIRTVDKGLIEMARVYGLSQTALFWRVILPGALPSVLVGLRYSLGIMWLTLIVAETISANAGIGYMTMNAREFLQTGRGAAWDHHLRHTWQSGRTR